MTAMLRQRKIIAILLFLLIFYFIPPVLSSADTSNQDTILYNPQVKEDPEGFVITKSKSALDFFEDGNYLYKLGHYEDALIMFNKSYAGADDINLKRKAKIGADIASLLLKAERVSPEKSQKYIKLAEKIKQRQSKEQISYLYEDALRYFYAEDYTKASLVFNDILSLDSNQKEAKEFLEIKIPQIFKEEKIIALTKDAVSVFLSNDYAKADMRFREILTLDPNNQLTQEYLRIKIPLAIRDEKIVLLNKEAIERFNNQEYGASAKLFDNILELDPNHKEAKIYAQIKIPNVIKEQKIKDLYKNAVTYFVDEDYDSAAKLFNEIITLDPQEKQAKEYVETKIPAVIKLKEIVAYLVKGITYYDQRDYTAATKIFTDILKLDPAQIEANEYLQYKIPLALRKELIESKFKDANLYFANNDFDKSSELFNSILKLEPDNRLAQEFIEVKIPQSIKEQNIQKLYSDGTRYFNLGDYPRATQAFKDILAINSDEKDAREYLNVKIPTGLRQQKIQSMYKEALEYFRSEDYEKSAERFNEIIALDPGQKHAQEYVEIKIPQIRNKQKAHSLYREAVASFNNRDYEKASEIFNQILALDPQQANTREYLETKIPLALKEQKINNLYNEAIDYIARRDYIKAKELFREIISLDPQQDKAIYYLQEKIPSIINKSEAQTLYAKAMIYFNSREYEKALGLFNELLILEPEHPNARIYVDKKIPFELRREKDRERQIFIQTEKERYLSVKQAAPKKSIDDLPPKPTNKAGVIGYLYDLAFQYYRAGKMEKSAEYFNKILLVNPDEFIAQSYLGHIPR